MAVAPPRVEHINPFIKATMETFSSMIGIPAKAGKIYLRKAGTQSYDISGIIGLSGGVQGNIALSFPKATALNVVGRFIGETIVDLNNDVVDAIGELANIVAGAAKRSLAEFNISISLPTVVTGSEHQVKDPKDVISMIIPFECEAGNFDLSVSMKYLDS